MPPYLAGRGNEAREFLRLLGQKTILENLVLTGLRGVGKTVLLDTFKPMAVESGWLWAGTDVSESTSISEESLATRLLADLAVVTSSVLLTSEQAPQYFAQTSTRTTIPLNFQTLQSIYGSTPGLVADRLKAVLEFAWSALARLNKRGLIFAYDEAQNLSDHSATGQYPLSLLLDVFQSIQRKNIPFMLALTGLPTLFSKLVEARTFAERMFRVVFLRALSQQDTKEAVRKPIADSGYPFDLEEASMDTIWKMTRGYPYFIQYVCREAFDIWVQNAIAKQPLSMIPVDGIVNKLDSDFFAGRWARVTDRQRQLLGVIAGLPHADGEFTVQEIVEQSKKALVRPFSASHVNQMLASLSDKGLIYKNRHGKYSFAVPLMAPFIKRQMADSATAV